jgi:DNA-binding transcriptional regulator YiaG
MEANPPPDLKPNKVPVAKLDAVKDALAIPDTVLAQRLGVTRQTLSAWRAAGEIPIECG